MDNKEFKNYKKELKGQSAHKKISNALASATHGIKAPMEMRKKLEGIKKNKKQEVVSKMNSKGCLAKAEKGEKPVTGKVTDKSDKYKRSLGRDAQLALTAKRLKTSRYDEFGREKKED